ncbi:MAG: lysostaphin resistance A-like protein [Candidatus Binatia bacterium]
MKSYKRILLFLLSVLALNCLISPWMAALWNLILDAVPEWRSYQQPFSRIFTRLYMIMGIVLFFFCRPLLKIESFSELGLTREPHWWRSISLGFIIACVSFAAILMTMTFADVFTPGFRRSVSTMLGRVFAGLMTGLTVGFLEEIFFRGMIFKGLMADTKPATAFLLANFFYAAIHFVKPAEKVPLSGIEPLAGFRHLISSFAPLLDPAEIFPGVIGLFLIGVALSYAFSRTGSLYLSIGLHAGWVFAVKTFELFGRAPRRDLGWIFGASNPKIVSGVATWIGVLIVLAVIHWLTRKPKPDR